MNDNSGWFKVSRKLFSHPIADDKPWDRLSAWLLLISLAAHDDYTTIIRQHEYPLKRGRLALSVADFGAKTGWSREKVRVFLAWLRKHGMIKLYSDHASTFVLIVNYDKWQGTEDNQPDNHESNQANNHESNQANNQADASTEEEVEGTDNQANNQPHNQADNQASEEKSPLASPLKKEGRRITEKDSTLPSKSKTYKIPHLTFNRETLTVDGFDDKARAYATTLFPNKDLDKAFHTLVEWIVKTDKRYLNFWKAYITICSGMPDEQVTRFNSGALKGQIYRVSHGASHVQECKNPLPLMDLSKILRKD
jgi:hypothetical protein